jgi:hypothetical protein
LGILAVAFLFLSSSAYIDYQQSMEADFLSAGKRYEDRDMDDFSLIRQFDFAITSNSFSIFSLLRDNLPASLTIKKVNPMTWPRESRNRQWPPRALVSHTQARRDFLLSHVINGRGRPVVPGLVYSPL